MTLPASIPPIANSAAIPPPLTPEQLHALQQSQLLARKVRKAVSVAKADAGIMFFFTAILLLGVLWGDWIGVVLGLGFSLVTFNSFRGAHRLEKYDLRAPRLLALNQFLLAAMIIPYALISLYIALHGVNDSANLKQLRDIMPANVASVESLIRIMVYILYIGLIAGTLIAQPLTAWYYFTRKTHIQRYLDATPPWIQELTRHTNPH